MKATIGEILIEGTPDEIGALIRKLDIGIWGVLQGKRDLLAPKWDSASEQLPERDTFVSEDFAYRVLKRRPLSKEQGVMLTMLAGAGSKWTTAHELQTATDYTRNQFGGLLGAFGKRIKATEGYINGQLFFDQEWDYEHSCFKYRLPATVAAAVKRAGF